jgi:hypothetical protein
MQGALATQFPATQFPNGTGLSFRTFKKPDPPPARERGRKFLRMCNLRADFEVGTQSDYRRAMACFINPIEEEQCVCLSCEGQIRPEELAAVSYEAHGLANTRRWTRMMLDMTQLRSSFTAAQLLDFAKVLAGQVPRNARVALVVRPDQTQRANLLEKAARKSGVFLAFFLDPERAAAWVKRTTARAGASWSHKLASNENAKAFRTSTTVTNSHYETYPGFIRS